MKFVALTATFALALAACSNADETTANQAVPAASVPGKAPPAGQSWTDVVSKTPEGGYRMGNPDAPIKLVEYGSRTCPTCGAFGREAMQPLENTYVKGGKVSYEFREFMVHGPPDLPASLLGRCAGPGPFFPILEQMYVGQAPFEEKLGDTNATTALQARLANATPPQIANAWADYMGFVDFVKQRGISEAKARACLNDTAAIDELTKMMDDAQRNRGVTGTPTFFINGKQAENLVTWSQMEQALKAAGA